MLHGVLRYNSSTRSRGSSTEDEVAMPRFLKEGAVSKVFQISRAVLIEQYVLSKTRPPPIPSPIPSPSSDLDTQTTPPTTSKMAEEETQTPAPRTTSLPTPMPLQHVHTRRQQQQPKTLGKSRKCIRESKPAHPKKLMP
ncbi:hypothetical protein L211DRAFT_843292 [Terfezia boudieri ATCC MYA-4762]|uniref:Uncharacterized protein n=1 Tax=Terfezia boudieri ATCC MYA-4762 TaxID=1051890 RepID=A0A3N4LDL5_9PEZI|nr:hypothetical protein L211DRAFT_843292 [Terfezia boudieri ATCC MYA-4762]